MVGIAIAESRFIGHGFAHAHAHQNALSEGVLLLDIVDVVCGDELNVEGLRELNQREEDLFLVFQAVILQLDVEVLTKDILELLCFRISTLFVSCEQLSGDIPLQAGREANDAFVVFLEKVHVDARLVIQAVGRSDAGQLEQVVIAGGGLRQQDDVSA